MAKKDLQNEAAALGVDFKKSDTVAVLKEKIAAAKSAPTHTRKTGDFLCPICNKIADHIHAKGV